MASDPSESVSGTQVGCWVWKFDVFQTPPPESARYTVLASVGSTRMAVGRPESIAL